MELWLPWIKIVGLALIAVAVVSFPFTLKRPWHQGFVIIGRVMGLLGAVPILFFSFFLLTAQGCEEDRRLIGSPDGKHVARLMIWGSVPTGTSVHVIERQSWSPMWQTVSEGSTTGTSIDPLEPRLSWNGNAQLLIDYPVATEGTGFLCQSKSVGDILIVCKTHKGN